MSVADFYNRLSPWYHLIYPDWDAGIERQAAELDGVVRELWGGRVETVLDATCGVGTQALGLAAPGYRVSASDISPAPLERAREEAARRGLSIDFRLADLRSLSPAHGKAFDLVIACESESLPLRFALSA